MVESKEMKLSLWFRILFVGLFYFIRKTEQKILVKLKSLDVSIPVNILVICEASSTASFLGRLLLLLQITVLNCL